MQDWQDWQSDGEGQLLVPTPVVLEAWRLHFGTLGIHLDDPWDPGGTLQDTLGSRTGFLSIFDGF